VVLTANYKEIQVTEHDLYLIHHFTQWTVHSFQSPESAAVYSNQGLSLANRFPYVMHAMIAVTACNLQHMGIDARQYRLPEAFHFYLACRGLRKAVATINGPKESDAVLTASMLLNALTFCAADYRDEPPFSTLGHQGPRWDWLRVQIGLTQLLAQTSPYRPQSIWNFTFQATDNLEITEPPRNNLGEQLAHFCGLDGNSKPEESPYLEPVRLLTPILARKPSLDYILLYLRTIGGFSVRFVDLLEEEHTRALLLFAHWLGLMCSIDQWWCVRRTRRECWTICDILSNRLDSDSLALLKFPAGACGYRFYDGSPEGIIEYSDNSLINE
jgi:hypothetical protein